jgi:hypothetical protein
MENRPLKPLAFIGSSVESLKVVDAIHKNLERDCEIRRWPNSFPVAASTIDSLVATLTEKQTDFAIFVIAGEDTVVSREQEQLAPRDNVIFELGLAIGLLSKDRVFMVVDRSVKPKIPTDLLGITPVTYEPPGRAKLEDALAPACGAIRERMLTLGLISDEKSKIQLDGLERYNQLVADFDSINIADMDARVRKRNEIGGRMGEFIIRQGIPKADISVQYSETSLVGLLFAIIITPQAGDQNLLLNVSNRIRLSYSKFKFIEALAGLEGKKYISVEDRTKFAMILKGFLPDNSTNLPRHVGRAMTALSDLDAIGSYTVPNGKLLINHALRISQGSPRWDYLDDACYEKVFHIEGTVENAIDCAIDVNGQVIKEIEYTFVDFKELIIYALVKIKQGPLSPLDFWLALKTTITEPTKISVLEWEVPVKADSDLGEWRRVVVSLPEAFRKTEKAREFSYINLEKIRFRGAGKIGALFVR